jgi:hypothetical protein
MSGTLVRVLVRGERGVVICRDVEVYKKVLVHVYATGVIFYFIT